MEGQLILFCGIIKNTITNLIFKWVAVTWKDMMDHLMLNDKISKSLKAKKLLSERGHGEVVKDFKIKYALPSGGFFH